jgi:hypothetical protein
MAAEDRLIVFFQSAMKSKAAFTWRLFLLRPEYKRRSRAALQLEIAPLLPN